ncbi:hypothetical protein [Frigoriflavimonas asaccharolytica]|uniref:SdiA-regulated protein n=1 Tax=Frigoriflavimonas asaccharolytica TaxID=2735899 RepID=A0A8J8G8K1_9FLAO|nr:hypothetical protein [Frigoriflavimonas asaccharolytica]NRS93311.1 hypothetical protein [Frigoriflavimonas asaccharolytica]
MKSLIIPILLIFSNSCISKAQKLEVVAELPGKINEASACEIASKSDLIWTIEDQKNDNVLLGLNKSGELMQKIKINNVENHDWEDLTSDEEGNIYIGDFGNNDNDRKNLAIYKINAADLNKDDVQALEVVQFFYPEQIDFPAKKKDRNFDTESFFIFENNFYLFTKNRSSNFDGTTNLYRVKNQTKEKLAAEKISSFVTCDDFNRCAITGADMSPNKKQVALLTSDKVFIFSDFKGDDFFSGKSQTIDLENYTQKEGICFEDDKNLLITDEASKKGSFLYRLKL